MASDGFVSASGQIAGNLPETISKYLIEPMSQGMSKLLMNTPNAGHNMGYFVAKALELRHWVPLAAQYELCGKQIFDLGDELVEMLANTDIGECTLESWQAPYETFFVRFGRQESTKLPYQDEEEDEFEYLDGAFVGVTPWDDYSSQRRIKFGFTTVRKNGKGMTMPGYFFDFTPEEQCMPIMLAIDHAITRRIDGFGDEDYGSEALNAHRKNLLLDNKTIIQQSVSLLINSLFYLESNENKGRNGILEPGRDAPPELVVAWAQTKPEKRDKLRRKINSDGYTLVRFFGKEFIGNGKSHAAGVKKTHWRKGHWRQQRYGAELALVKRLWIKPTIINSEQQHDDLAGHIYVVGSPSGGKLH